MSSTKAIKNSKSSTGIKHTKLDDLFGDHSDTEHETVNLKHHTKAKKQKLSKIKEDEPIEEEKRVDPTIEEPIEEGDDVKVLKKISGCDSCHVAGRDHCAKHNKKHYTADDYESVSNEISDEALANIDVHALVIANKQSIVKKDISTAVAKAENVHLESIKFLPTKSLFKWYGSQNGYKLTYLDMKPFEFYIRIKNYNQNEIAEKKLSYPLWEKSRDVYISCTSKQKKEMSDKLVPFGLTFLYPHMKVGLTQFGEFGNALDKSDYAPKDEKHRWSRVISFTDDSFDSENCDTNGKNPMAVAAFDWLDKLNDGFLQKVLTNTDLVKEIKDKCKDDAKKFVVDKKQAFFYGQDPDMVAGTLFQNMLSHNVKEKDGKKSIFLSADLFRNRTKEERERGYTAPTPGLQALIGEIGDPSYKHYEDGKHANKAVYELPVFVKKTREEVDETRSQWNALAPDDKLKNRAELLSPYKRVPFTETFKIGSEHRVAPLVTFRVNEGAKQKKGYGLTQDLLALFWDPSENDVFENTLMAEPFYAD